MKNKHWHARRIVQDTSIGQYVLEALRQRGVRHIFGVPGDFTITLCAAIEQSGIEFIVCRNELNAAYAAEGYARAAGLGVVTATYDVGGYSALNGIALANAENTPLLMLTGSPGLAERINDPELHHKSGPFENQAETFRLHTMSSSVLTNPLTAFAEIDRVLNDVTLHKRPGYIEIPRDMVNIVPATKYLPQKIRPYSDAETLQLVLDESKARLAHAKRPVIVAGVEIHRFGLQDELLRFLDLTGIPLAATLLSKSVIDETHPLFVGLYAGHLGDQAVTQLVESSDCVLFLGVIMSDIDVGKAPGFDHACAIYARNGHFQAGEKHFFGVQLADYLPGLAGAVPRRPQLEDLSRRTSPAPAAHAPDEPISVDSIIGELNKRLDERSLVICDIGDALFAALELRMPRRSSFFANAYYASMGHAVPAAVGVHFALPDTRKIVLCGDGGFQMTFQELSTAIAREIPLIVIVLDNNGFETERRLFPGAWHFNDIPSWDYKHLTAVFKGGRSWAVKSVAECRAALDAAWDYQGVSLIHAQLPPGDCSTNLKRLGEELGVKGR